MDSADIVDDVNALLKLGVGDPYRLEHIKQAYILNKTIWKSDDKYLKQLRIRYLVRHKIDQPDIEPEIDKNLENDSENNDIIHCWKCGKKGPLGANFCMICGSSIFEVGTESQTADVQMPSNSKKQTKTSRLKIPIIIGIPVLILIIIGGAYSQGFFDNAFEKYSSDDSIDDVIDSKSNVIDSKDSGDETTLPTEINSKCGAGTIFDSETNSCVLPSEINSADITNAETASTGTSSKCGTGTIFDPKTNSCVLDK